LTRDRNRIRILILFMATPSSALEWVKPPLQARSAQTLERMLDAAEAMIAERGVAGTTVAGVARRAGSSVGAFYARFPDKEALVRCVFGRFIEQAEATVDDALSPDRWAGIALTNVVESAVTFMIGIFHGRRKLIGAFSRHAAVDSSMVTIGERLGTRIAARALALLDRRAESVDHPDPAQAVAVAVWLVLSALEALAAVPAGDRERLISDEVLATEISRMVTMYLGVRDPKH
jgi:AcrR family transcriptional regulator